MEYGLTNDELIFGLLRCLIHEPYLCKKIIKDKKSIEEIEIVNYHIDRWENIAGNHYVLREAHHNLYSLIFNDTDYVVKVDHKPYFYNETGMSYQIVDLIHELIKLKNPDSIENTFVNDCEKCIKYDDKLYSKLSKKIMVQMKLTYK